MYKLTKTNSNFDLMYALDGNDIYNSKFIYDIDNIDSDRVNTYKNIRYVGRLDLVSGAIYDKVDKVPYEVMAILNRFHQEDDTVYKKVDYLSETTIRELKLG